MKINEKSNDELSKIKLSEILDTIENGNRPKGGIKDLDEGVPSLGGEHLTKLGGFNFKKLRLVSQEYYYSLKRGKIKQNDVLIVKDGATTGKVSFVDEDFPFQEAAVNEHVFILRGKKDLIHPKFLFYHIFSPFGQLQIMKNFRGAAIGGINTQFVKNYYIYLSPLQTQKKIVEILENAEKLKVWRVEADELADEYLKSVFLEMFGSPKDNPFKWKLVTVDDIATKVTDGEHKTPKRTKTGIKLLSARNVRMGHIDFSFGLDYVPTDEYERIKKRCNPEYGDLLISCSGVIIGRVATIKIKEPLALVRSAALIKPKKDLINSLYLEHYLRTDYLQLLMKRSSKASGQPNLFTGPLKKIPVLLPPLNLQNQFAEIVQKVETLKSYQSQSKKQIDNLFNTLMQKAFKGELVC